MRCRQGARTVFTGLAVLAASGLLLSGQLLPDARAQERSFSSSPYDWNLPPWMPPPPEPMSNPTTAAKVELGRRLFYDGRLAADFMRSCASCHQQKTAFSDAAPFSWGVTGQLTARNTPSLTNVGYAQSLTWVNPYMRDLEAQARAPLFGEHPIEMGMANQQEELARRLAADPVYRDLFPRAFPAEDGQISVSSITAALAAFERTLVSARSPYDEYRFGNKPSAISEAARRGEALFFSDRLKCRACHGDPLFGAGRSEKGSPLANFHNTGLYNLDASGGYPPSNPGLIANTANPSDMGKFKTPGVRNIAVTAPYMHDGSLRTLAEVLDYYAAGGRVIPEGEAFAGDGRKNPLKDPLITGFDLSQQEKQDVIAFLESLTDPTFLNDPRLANPWR